MNFMDVTVKGVAGSSVTVASAAIEPVAVEAPGFSVGDRALLGVRPQYLRQDAPGAGGTMKGTVALAERLGTETIVSFETPSSELALAVIPRDEAFEAGSTVEFGFDPKVAQLFPA
jgi:multiple sugar transport system ATP-binding protein